MIEPRTFTARQSELPMLYVLLGLMLIELFALHLFLSHWSTTAAWIVSLLTVLLLGTFLRALWRIARRPSFADEHKLCIRSGLVADVPLAWHRIAAVRGIGFGPRPGGADVLVTTIVAHPNIAVELREPLLLRKLVRTKAVTLVALCVDEPEVLLALAQARIGSA